MWDTGDIGDSVRTLGTECEIQCGILGSVGWTIQAEKLRGRPQKSRLVVVGPGWEEVGSWDVDTVDKIYQV